MRQPTVSCATPSEDQGKKNNRVHVVPCVSIVIKKQKEKEMGSKHREKEPRKEGRGLRFWVNSRSRNHSW